MYPLSSLSIGHSFEQVLGGTLTSKVEFLDRETSPGTGTSFFFFSHVILKRNSCLTKLVSLRSFHVARAQVRESCPLVQLPLERRP